MLSYNQNRGDRISSIGTTCDSYPPSAFVLDAQEGVVMPGFVDAHAHWTGTSRYWV